METLQDLKEKAQTQRLLEGDTCLKEKNLTLFALN